MSKLKYYNKDDLLEKCSTGKINIHQPIKLKNKTQNTLHYISFLKHLLYICQKDEKESILNNLFTIKSKIENEYKKSIRNGYFHKCIERTIEEWNIDIEPEKIFNNTKDKYNYNNFIKNNKNYNELIFNINGLQNIIEKKNNKYDDDIKDSILIVLENTEEYIINIKEDLEKLIIIINNIEPEHNYLITDLSTKSKDVYMEYVEENIKNASFFESLISNKSDAEIPDNINIIFLNYIIIINMLKKELHYIITIYQSIMNKLEEKYNMLNKIKESLNIKDNIKKIDNKSLFKIGNDEPIKEIEEELTFF